MTAIDASVSELSLVSRRPLSADFTLFTASTSSSVGDTGSVRSSSTSASELEPCTPAALLGSSPTSPSSVRPYDALESTGAASTLHGLLARPPVSRAQHTAQRFDRNNGAILNGTHRNNSNWLADLSVEVCKVDSEEEEEEEEEEEDRSSSEEDWDESVFFEAVTGGHTNPGNQNDGLDVLLGRSDLLEGCQGTTTAQSYSNNQILPGISSCSEEVARRTNQVGPASGSPPSTPSPSSSGGRCQQQPLPQPPQPCSMCSKVFTSTSALAKHKLTHSDERRFSCQLCGKAFKRQDHLNGHLITHREKKPFECRADGCGKSYCDARSLRRHQDNHHAGITQQAGSAQQQSSPGHHPSRSSSSSSSAGLFISELSAGGSTDLLPGGSAASYLGPNSNSSSGSAATGHYGSNWTATVDNMQYDSSPVFTESQQPLDQIAPAAPKSKTNNKTAGTQKNNNVKSSVKKAKTAAAPKTVKVKGKSSSSSEIQQHPNSASMSAGAGNDGLTTQQLELIQEIMRQTQEQHRLMQEEQQLLNHKPTATNNPAGSAPAPSNGTAKLKKPKVKWTPPPTSDQAAASRPNPPAPPTETVSQQNSPAVAAAGRPVECNVCQRRFKNTPALNGHMRLHGGFLKKDAECGNNSNGTGSGGSGASGNSGNHGNGSSNGGKKPGESSKRDPNNPPLLTASVSIRALIEEKIIQRRNNMAANSSTQQDQQQQRSIEGSSKTTINSATPAVVSLAPIQDPPPPTPQVSLITDVLQQVDHPVQIQQTEVQNMIPKLEPEAYFEGSLLALSPVSLHRALEGDMDVNDEEQQPGSDRVEQQVFHHHSEDFFSTSSSSSSALSDVPLLDDSVFHQVSAAAASALLSDISSLDLQSYIDSDGTGQNGLSHDQTDDGQADDGPYSDCLSQYLAASGADHVNNPPDVYQTDFHHIQQHQPNAFVSYQSETGGPASFGFDPSTPLSSLCSPPHYNVQQQYHLPVQEYNNNPAETNNGFHQPSMMIPATAVPSPYTPSPSPVSPAVHLQRFQQQQHQNNGFYSPASVPASSSYVPQATSSTSFMIDCANSVLYNMGESAGSGWDHAADLNTVSADAIPQLMEHHQQLEELTVHHQINKPAAVPVGKVKKPRLSRAKKASTDEHPPEANKNKRKKPEGNNKVNDELDELLTAARASPAGRFNSLIRSSTALLLDPKRAGSGLYWNSIRNNGGIIPPVPAAPSLSGRQLMKSRVRVGKEHQCAALPRCKKKEGNKDKEPAVLCWNGNSSSPISEQQVMRLLAWSRSSALPGPRKSEEEVLAVLTHFRNDLQAAKLHLFTQSSTDLHQSNSDSWSPEEVAIFHAALVQHGKNFSQVAQHIPSKTAGQCVQFYYLWKKLCRPQDYSALKIQRHRNAASNQTDETTSLSDWADVGGVADMLALSQTSNHHQPDCSSSSSSTSLQMLLPSCEFADCPAISNNRTASDMLLDKLYPCSVCHKVFDKVKSRSAHMKTHKAASSATTSPAANINNGKHHNSKSLNNRKSPPPVMRMTATPSPMSSTSHSSLSSTSLPSPFLPTQSLF